MKPLGCLGIGLSIVSGCLLLALVAELYYFFWWKKRRSNVDIERSFSIPGKELPYLFCWKKPSFLIPAALNSDGICTGADHSDDGHGQPKPLEDDAELMCLAGYQRSLFTIEEETQDDLESCGSKKGPIRKSLRDLLQSNETPTATPLSSPALTPMACQKKTMLHSQPEASSSPPPTFKFLRDAEEKLYRKTLVEEALKVQISCRQMENRDRGQQSSQVANLVRAIAEKTQFFFVFCNAFRSDRSGLTLYKALEKMHI
ncbi:hypothetical protein ZIOFF_055746 [Zingiber officinale]|nr:hypothetical protein ZIOFF_055746 [Zingiber officinale]